MERSIRYRRRDPWKNRHRKDQKTTLQQMRLSYKTNTYFDMNHCFGQISARLQFFFPQFHLVASSGFNSFVRGGYCALVNCTFWDIFSKDVSDIQGRRFCIALFPHSCWFIIDAVTRPHVLLWSWNAIGFRFVFFGKPGFPRLAGLSSFSPFLLMILLSPCWIYVDLCTLYSSHSSFFAGKKMVSWHCSRFFYRTWRRHSRNFENRHSENQRACRLKELKIALAKCSKRVLFLVRNSAWSTGNDFTGLVTMAPRIRL